MTLRSIGAAAMVALAAWCATSAAEAACTYRGLRSQNSRVPQGITFVNASGMYRSLQWIDFAGQPKDYGGMNPGESKYVNTFLTHPWMITDGPGNCIQIVMPRAGMSVVRLAGAAPVRAKPARGEEGSPGLTGCPPGTVSIPETDNCRPVRRRGRPAEIDD